MRFLREIKHLPQAHFQIRETGTRERVFSGKDIPSPSIFIIASVLCGEESFPNPDRARAGMPALPCQLYSFTLNR